MFLTGSINVRKKDYSNSLVNHQPNQLAGKNPKLISSKSIKAIKSTLEVNQIIPAFFLSHIEGFVCFLENLFY